jgi:zinc/manganese transport system permease protein
MIEALRFPFLVHALLASSFAAVVAAIGGYFLILRGLTFAGHALPNIGFAGAAGAVLLGIEPVYGLFALTISAGVVVGLAGSDIRERDISTGVVMTFALGLGLLFLSLYSGYAARVYGILFGNILGISMQAVIVSAVASAVILVVLVVVYRPLLFSTFDPAAAEARGVPVRLLSVVFMIVIAVTVSLAIQVMGALLVFTLLVGPAATAVRIVRSPPAALGVSVGLGLLYVFLGMLLAVAMGRIPVSFFIATLSFIVYLPVRLLSARGREES